MSYIKQKWENKFASWSKGPEKAEENRIINLKNEITEAVKICFNPSLPPDYSIDVHGSFKMRTNVRKDSDIDIQIYLIGCFQPEIFRKNDTPCPWDWKKYKDLVWENLNKRTDFFKNIERGNKSFKITSRKNMNADIIVTVDFIKDTNVGRCFLGNDETRIINWPKQNFENGEEKHRLTSRRFKKIVRIFKNLKNEMIENKKIRDSKSVSSFLIESLIYNVSDNELFLYENFYDCVAKITEWLIYALNNPTQTKNMKEINEINPLFSEEDKNENEIKEFLLKVQEMIKF